MEYDNSPEGLNDESPSQEEIVYSHPMKLHLESVDDFEHVTKDVSPSKEATAQFLHHETSYASNQNLIDKSRECDDDMKSFDVFSEKQETDLPPVSSDAWAAESSSLMNNAYTSSELMFPSASSGEIDSAFEDDIALSKNFMQYEKEHEKNKSHLPPSLSEKIEAEADDNKLIDFEPSVEFETSGKPGEYILTNNSEILMPNPLTDSKTSPTTVGSQSLPGIIKPEKDSDIYSESIPQGDGLHLRQTVGLDSSDTEDPVPEPLPKDYPEIGVIEAKDFLSALGIDNWFRPERLNPKVESLIYWRDVKKSGVVFGCGLTALLSLCYYSLISVVAYSSLLVLTAAVSFRIYKNVMQAVQKTSDGHPFKTTLLKILHHKIVTEVFDTIKEFLDMDMGVNPEKTREVLETLVQHLNKGLIELRRLFLVEDMVDSIKFGFLLWAMTYVGSWFNGLSLIIIGFVALFTLPKVYENNKTQIDANLDDVKAKINEMSDKLKAIIPLGKKEDEVKSKGE